jgi:hypothetical protein
VLKPGAIEATRLNLGGLSKVTVIDRTATTGGGWFYPSGYSLPWLGKYVLVVTVGPNWGCFIYTL